MSRTRGTRLQAVLRVRRVQEQQAAGRLAAANTQLRDAQDVLRARQADLATRWADREVVELSWQAAARATDVVVDRTAAADATRADWQVAARRVKGLERLDERRRAEAAAEDLRRQAIILDELATIRTARLRSGR